eukprot:CAMPEP_0195521438 /NCGR_PEP_ID=MMETSP0794_2-20130614/18664_1 /TAXON_ID=515487 /ORGANISM="Stephanopyxis turris, Strain CCMP 815" /LENGTH=77 /DNA_ID=CAMNT_0040650991 /DNA_START=71 /DNA_END=304 /DNA_ORIENTATION=+
MGNSSSSEQAAEAPKPVELAPNGEPKPKCPMCVCKELRAERDSCMLEHEDGKTACKEQIDALNKCLQGYGFNIPAAK